jgi:hypothetical protein
MPKIVFLAHPIRGDSEGNIKKVLELCKKIHSDSIIPCVPYIARLQYLDDAKGKERNLGIAANKEYFERKLIDEVWLCGPTISEGMKAEIELAQQNGIPIHCHNPALQKQLGAILNEY